MFALPETFAKNCCVLAPPLEGAIKAYVGEIATATGTFVPAMSMVALPLREASALLVAVRITGFVAGAD